MKKKLLFSAALVCLLALGFTGCGDNGDPSSPPGGGDGEHDTALVGKWYASQEDADAETAFALSYEFKSDGKIFTSAGDSGMTWTTSGGKITTSVSGHTAGTADYSTAGTTLTISNTGNSGLFASTYYKKGAGGDTTYTVTYNGNGSTGGSVPADTNSPYADGAKVTVLGNTGNLQKTGHTFAGWNTAAGGTGGTSYGTGATFNIAANTTLYARWVSEGTPTYTVTFNSNGGAAVTAIGDVASGEKIAKPVDPARPGYALDGWYKEAGLETKWDFAADTVTDNTTLYAKWTEAAGGFSITGYDGATPAVYAVNGNPATFAEIGTSYVAAGSFVSGGGGLINWSYNGTLNGTYTIVLTTGSIYKKAVGIKITNGNGSVAYASFVDFGGSSTDPGGGGDAEHDAALVGKWYSTQGEADAAVESSPIVYEFKSDGKLFNNIGNSGMTWKTSGGKITTSASGITAGSATYTISGTRLTISNAGNSGLRAGTYYKKGGGGSTDPGTGTTYTVTYNGNGSTGGSVPADSNSPYASGATVTVLGNVGNLQKTGHTFAGWNTKADGTGTDYAANATFTVTGNTTLYAKWTQTGTGTTYTVTYDGNGSTGGTVPTDSNSPYAAGATVTVLDNTGNLQRTGYAFDRWNTAANGTNGDYAANETFTVARNTTFYAQWLQNGAWSSAGGSGIYGPNLYSSSDLNVIAYGGDKFVAMGFGEKMAYSLDGKTWTAADSKLGADSSINDIAYGDGKFVAVAGIGYPGVAAYSPDGVTWTATTLEFVAEGIAYGDGKFVAVGFNNRQSSGDRAAYSSDGGATWTSATRNYTLSHGNDIAYGGGKFVAVGNGGTAAHSLDGATWTAVTDTTFGYSDINGIAYGDGKFVAVGRDGKAAYSPDGITWTAVADSKFGGDIILGITYGGGRFAAVGVNGKSAYSPDGITWTAGRKFGDSIFMSVAYGSGKFVAVRGSYTGIAYTYAQE